MNRKPAGTSPTSDQDKEESVDRDISIPSQAEALGRSWQMSSLLQKAVASTLVAGVAGAIALMMLAAAALEKLPRRSRSKRSAVPEDSTNTKPIGQPKPDEP